ncbi:MAG TPA: serine hydrolase domain-containing protein, partial [Nocardioidaceae bacterium]|nr:serine hydrolase domain-containing protein [Nocardioidaceae bacterium]
MRSHPRCPTSRSTPLAVVVLLLLVLISAGCRSATTTPTSQTSRTQPPAADRGPHAEIQKLVKSAVSVDAYPGLVAWVQDGDRTTVFAHGVANTRTQARMTGRHRFKIASITKPMVAAVVLQLAEEGELSLSDSLEDWLPDTFSRGDDISIEHLLTHSSGLVDFDAIERLGKLVDSGRATPRSVVALSAK